MAWLKTQGKFGIPRLTAAIFRIIIDVYISVWPIHGSPTPLAELLELTGYEYPNYSVCDMRSGPPLC
jgi:hypothetical protein